MWRCGAPVSGRPFERISKGLMVGMMGTFK
jgi:hypothetical protein